VDVEEGRLVEEGWLVEEGRVEEGRVVVVDGTVLVVVVVPEPAGRVVLEGLVVVPEGLVLEDEGVTTVRVTVREGVVVVGVEVPLPVGPSVLAEVTVGLLDVAGVDVVVVGTFVLVGLVVGVAG
jgi:hypothetical protein